MTRLRIFVSSVQREFARDRRAIADYLRDDPLLRQFFEVFLFEEAPAADRRPDDLYLDEVERCDLYLGLLGAEYGSEDRDGVSPTEREFDHATTGRAHRLIFLKRVADADRHPKMRALIGRAEAGLVRRQYEAVEELRAGLYAALVEYLKVKGLLRLTPFDATPCKKATVDDLDFEGVSRFVDVARRVRGFRLTGAQPEEVLTHLDLLDDGVPANAAVLLFGKAPQRFVLSSEVRCAHFHGTEVEKPIPSHQTYLGTAFRLVDQAVDFVLSKIDRIIGTRANGPRAPRVYEIPPEVVIEAIVNAVAHRDYSDDGSVQVMLFSDRLEIRNPGRLPPPLTFDELRVPHRSIPGNPLLARPLYLADYIERMGTGTLDMIRRCAAAGLPEPEFSFTDGFVTTVRRLPPGERMAARLGSDSRLSDVQPESESEVQPESGSEMQPESGSEMQPESRLHPEDKSLSQLMLESELQPESDSSLQPESVPVLQPESVPSLQPESVPSLQPESRQQVQPESGHRGPPAEPPRPEPLDIRVLRILADGPMSKASLSADLGQKTVSGRLNEVIRRLVVEGVLAPTIPDRPRSRFQQYRLTVAGRARLRRQELRSPTP